LTRYTISADLEMSKGVSLQPVCLGFKIELADFEFEDPVKQDQEKEI
jgi:hypothetical protein